MNNSKTFTILDIIFTIRGFMALVFVPLTLIIQIEPFTSLLIQSNIYLNNSRYPDLYLPAVYCSSYLIFVSINLLIFNKFFQTKFSVEYFNKFDSLKLKNNENELILILIIIFLILKLRVLSIDNYFSEKYLLNFYISNKYVAFLCHFFLPNELLYLAISLFYQKFDKLNNVIKVFTIIVIFCVFISTLNFGSRFLQIVSFIIIIPLFLKLLISYKIRNILIFITICFLIFKIIIPSAWNNEINFFAFLFDHLLWRLDVYHLVDIGKEFIGQNFENNNLMAQSFGVSSFNDNNTGIGVPAFFYYLNNEYNLFLKLSIIYICSLIVIFMYSFLKNLTINFGSIFCFLIIIRFALHWPEHSILILGDYLLKVLICISIYTIVKFSINFKKKFI